MAWRKGVLVVRAPDVIYAEDTNGDGRADVTRKLLTGFATHNYQGRVNGLSLGLDNWIYGAAGIFGGKVTTPDGKLVDAANRDFRLRPDEALVEPVSGRTQQGRARRLGQLVWLRERHAAAALSADGTLFLAEPAGCGAQPLRLSRCRINSFRAASSCNGR